MGDFYKNNFEKNFYYLTKGEYTVLSEYVSSQEKMWFTHNNPECNYHKFQRSWFNFKRTPKCPMCEKTKKREKEKKIGANKLFEKTNGEYEVIRGFENQSTPCIVRHNCKKCENFEFTTTPNRIVYSKTICPKCKKCINSHEKFVSEVKKINIKENEDYEVLTQYTTSTQKLEMRHNSKECNFHVWGITPNKFLQGRRCPKCKESKGEKLISKWLDNRKINYLHNRMISKNCKYKKPLRFDFQIFTNNTLLCAIEYDGIQHFQPSNKFGVEEFKKTKKRDQIKNKYCKDNNIPLIRIPYWDFDNIETILEKELTELGIIREKSIESILV